MTGREIIGEVMKVTGTRNNDLARKMGITSALMSSRVQRSGTNDIPVNILSDTVSAMGYKVVVIPKETEVGEGFVVE